MTSSSSTNESSEAVDSAEGAPSPAPSSRRTRRHRRRSGGRSVTYTAGVVAAIALIVGAPLAAGAVHRVPAVIVMGVAVLALALVWSGLTLQGRRMRLGLPVVLPLVLVLVPALQSLPLPLAFRKAVDPHGTALLLDNYIGRLSAWPLSLDPANTRVYIGRAAAALVAFLVAYHLSSGQRWRHAIPRALGVAGVVAVTIGLGHRVLGFNSIYGVLNTPQRTLLLGPFVNANHTAEFLELAAFVCLACSFHNPTALNRIGWLTGFLFCAGGALATLSRGAFLAIAIAIVVFAVLHHTAREGVGAARRRSTLFWGLALLAMVGVTAAALGAGQVIDRFHSQAVGTDIRLRLWRDALNVLAAHPTGIGRGAFDRVYPVYRTLVVPVPVRFSFVENEPLQLLIDSGWLLAALVAAAIGVGAWTIARHGRRDRVQAALVAGLAAVVAHGFVDFGLETPGVLIPFMAVFAIVVGRGQIADTPPSRRLSIGVAAAACAALVIGIGATVSPASDNFDALVKKAQPRDALRATLERAQKTHPIDYYYALLYARTEPLKSLPGQPSPRLRALNRALRLCPGCAPVHAEVARNLWQLGVRGQALVEWRAAVDLEPDLFRPALQELFSRGAKPEQLAAVASSTPSRMVDVADFLSSVSRADAAFVVLNQADALGAPRANSLLTRGKLQVQVHDLPGAQTTVAQAHAAGIQDPRLAVLDAQVTLATRGAAGAERALSVLDIAAARFPNDVPINRMRVEIVLQYERWQAAERAIDGFKMALYRSIGSAGEALTAAARVQSRLGHWTAAINAYRIALAEDRGNVWLWVEFGEVAERAGRNTTAREAYTEAARLSPNDPQLRQRLRTLDERQAKLRAADMTTPRVPF